MIWANRSLDLITIGSMIYCNALFPQLFRTNMADLLLTCSDDNIRWKVLFGSYIPRPRLESVIPVQYPHWCGDWLHSHLKTLDSSALEPCSSTSHAIKIIPQVTAIEVFKQRWRQRGKTYGLQLKTTYFKSYCWIFIIIVPQLAIIRQKKRENVSY